MTFQIYSNKNLLNHALSELIKKHAIKIVKVKIKTGGQKV